MSNQKTNQFHTVDEEWLASYSVGGLSALKRLVISCQAEIQPTLLRRINQLDAVGGAFLETASRAALTDDFTARLMMAIDENARSSEESVAIERPLDTDDVEGWMPSEMHKFLERSNLQLKWRNAGPGVMRASLVDDGVERLYFLKAKPGLTLPMHSHHGEEWTLILQGGYHVGTQGYVRGDLHREDETCTHQPIIDDDNEDCISLVVDEGRLRFTDPIMKILQPLLKI